MKINKKRMIGLLAVLTLLLGIFSVQVIQAGGENPLKAIILDQETWKTDDGPTTMTTFGIPE
ncbi:MAG: hypothetical protein BWY74_03325 [Firmicutes bacterium ADurb.Bin419]|nr:MAG: hypothetical protein BWY74_03325 [Firmicutes bacterium ADurb.Bin419]